MNVPGLASGTALLLDAVLQMQRHIPAPRTELSQAVSQQGSSPGISRHESISLKKLARLPSNFPIRSLQHAPQRGLAREALQARRLATPSLQRNPPGLKARTFPPLLPPVTFCSTPSTVRASASRCLAKPSCLWPMRLTSSHRRWAPQPERPATARRAR